MNNIECQTCRGDCRVPMWTRDSSYFANDLFGFAAHMARAHEWVTPERLAFVEAVRAEIRAMSPATTYACEGCGRYAFPSVGVLCFWCRRRSSEELARLALPVQDPTKVPTVKGKPEPPPTLPLGRRKAMVDPPPSLF